MMEQNAIGYIKMPPFRKSSYMSPLLDRYVYLFSSFFRCPAEVATGGSFIFHSSSCPQVEGSMRGGMTHGVEGCLV
jgi:hypothetical protein